MKTFKDYLLEAEGADGTYAALYPTSESISDLYVYVSDVLRDLAIPIDNKVSPYDYHCTVMYSRRPIHDFEKHGDMSKDVNIVAKATKFSILKAEKKTLVLEIRAPEIDELFKQFIKLGATWDFKEYLSHISIANDVDLEEKNLPPITKPLNIHFSKLKVVPLDLDHGEEK